MENKFLLHSFNVFLTLARLITPVHSQFFWLFCTTLFLEKGNVSCQSQLCYWWCALDRSITSNMYCGTLKGAITWKKRHVQRNWFWQKPYRLLARWELWPFFGSHGRTSHVQIKVRTHVSAHPIWSGRTSHPHPHFSFFFHQFFKLFSANFQNFMVKCVLKQNKMF